MEHVANFRQGPLADYPVIVNMSLGGWRRLDERVDPARMVAGPRRGRSDEHLRSLHSRLFESSTGRPGLGCHSARLMGDRFLQPFRGIIINCFSVTRTSMASPHVADAVPLPAMNHPSLTAQEAEAVLEAAAPILAVWTADEAGGNRGSGVVPLPRGGRM